MAEVVFRLLLHLLFVLFLGGEGLLFFRNPFASFLDSQDSSSISLFEIEPIISNHDSFPPHPESACNQPSYPKVHLNSASGYYSDVFSHYCQSLVSLEEMYLYYLLVFLFDICL